MCLCEPLLQAAAAASGWQAGRRPRWKASLVVNEVVRVGLLTAGAVGWRLGGSWAAGSLHARRSKAAAPKALSLGRCRRPQSTQRRARCRWWLSGSRGPRAAARSAARWTGPVPRRTAGQAWAGSPGGPCKQQRAVPAAAAAMPLCLVPSPPLPHQQHGHAAIQEAWARPGARGQLRPGRRGGCPVDTAHQAGHHAPPHARHVGSGVDGGVLGAAAEAAAGREGRRAGRPAGR